MAEVLISWITRSWSWREHRERSPLKKNPKQPPPTLKQKNKHAEICMGSAPHFYHSETTFNLRRNLCATFAETYMSKYLCADVQLLWLHASPSKIKVLSTLWSASTKVEERESWEGTVFYSVLLNKACLYLHWWQWICGAQQKYCIYEPWFSYSEILPPKRWIKVNIKLTLLQCCVAWPRKLCKLSEKGMWFWLSYQPTVNMSAFQTCKWNPCVSAVYVQI